MEASFNTPMRSTSAVAFASPLLSTGPRTGAGSAGHRHADRYIPNRASQDNTLSHYLLTTKENMTPMRILYGSPQREDSVASSAAFARSPIRMDGGSPSEGDLASPLPAAGAGSTTAEPATGSPTVITDIFAKMRLEASGSRPNNASGGSRSPSMASPLTAGSGGVASGVVELEPYTTKLARALFSDAPQTTVLGIHSQRDGAASGGGGGNENGALGHGGIGGGAASENARYANSLGVVFEHNRTRNFKSKSFRLIAQTPERILDASNIIDDFYLNLIDCSSTDVLSVALQSTIYLWHSASRYITQLPSVYERDGAAAPQIVCGLNWAPDGRHLAVGLSSGTIDVWDVEAEKVVRRWSHHGQRVGSLSWTENGSVLASGSRDATVRLQDTRDHAGAAHVLRAHTHEVCGLRWSPNGIHLASGGNDNQLLIWDRRGLSGGGAAAVSSSPSAGFAGTHLQPLLRLNQHTAAVKALAWNPMHPSLLVSGGGTEDRTLRFWDTLTGECLQHVDTQSQVCRVLWSRSGTELISSHGFSLNQLSIWKYPSLRRVADLTGHTSRVLHLCMSADGEVVISAAGDETIRFWRCFPPMERPPPASSPSPSFSLDASFGGGGHAAQVFRDPAAAAFSSAPPCLYGGSSGGAWSAPGALARSSASPLHQDPSLCGELALR